LEGREHDDTVMSLAIAFRVLDEGASQASFSIIGEGVQNDEGAESEDLDGEVVHDSSSDVKLGIV